MSTRKDKPMTPEETLNVQIDILAKNAQDPEEISKVLTLLKQKEELRKLKRARFPSPDSVMQVVANLGGILIITQHEKLNVIASKALGFVIKGRV